MKSHYNITLKIVDVAADPCCRLGDWRLIDAVKVDTTRDLLEVVVGVEVEQLVDVAAGPCLFLAD